MNPHTPDNPHPAPSATPPGPHHGAPVPPQDNQPSVSAHGQPPRNDKATKSLAISLVVSAVLLLAAIGIALWLFFGATQPGEDQSKGTSEDTSDVTKVSLMPPTDLPKAYAVSDQSTHDATVITYFDSASGCGITSSVSLLGKDTPKQSAEKFTQHAASIGVSNANTTNAGEHKLKDAADSDQQYTFASFDTEQNVDTPGVDFNKQRATVLYRQFAAHVALLSYSCKDSTWASKKDELQTIANNFTVKTERG